MSFAEDLNDASHRRYHRSSYLILGRGRLLIREVVYIDPEPAAKAMELINDVGGWQMSRDDAGVQTGNMANSSSVQWQIEAELTQLKPASNMYINALLLYLRQRTVLNNVLKLYTVTDPRQVKLPICGYIKRWGIFAKVPAGT